MDQNEKFAQLRLIRSKKISNVTFWNLLKKYKTAQNAISAIKDSSQYELCSIAVLQQEIDSMKRIGARFIFFDSKLYPSNLKLIDNPPPILSFLGNTEMAERLLAQKTLAVVGARNATFNGMRFCFGICSQLANNGITVVSGLAKGIDTSAHKGSLSAGTIAILAGGINYIYPPENKNLYTKILENGGVFAEMPYNAYPAAGLFPKRNRIIAGISDGTLVVEAASKSGSLITAELAKNFRRQIFAVPNSPLDVRSQGTNDLIKKGAIVVTRASDVLNVFYKQTLFSEGEVNITKFDYKITVQNDIKKEILRLIDTYSLKVDELINCIQAPAEQTLLAIVELEMQKKIKRTISGDIIYTGS